MKTIRLIASAVFGLVATLTLLFGALSANTSLVERTIEDSRKLELSFQEAIACVETRIRDTGSPPTAKEFEAWANSFPLQPYSINGMMLDLPPYSPEFVREHGRPPKNGYGLSYWRGEWMESYVSWTRKSSLVFDQSAYFMFGSSALQTMGAFLLTLVLTIAAIAVWPRGKHAA
jgi:hypothetical protein